MSIFISHSISNRVGRKERKEGGEGLGWVELFVRNLAK